MRLERHKNFLTPQECSVLNAWVDEGVQKKWLDTGIDGGSSTRNRLTSRMYGGRYENPQIVLDISNRIRNYCGIDSYKIIDGHGRDGVAVSCTFDGGDVYKHKDPRSQYGLSALRCNVVTRAADSGGVLYLEGEMVDLEVGELHCYLASDFYHEVTEVKGKTPRVLWMFGAYVPPKHWEDGTIKVGGNDGK